MRQQSYQVAATPFLFRTTRTVLWLFLLLAPVLSVYGQGKIAGTVTDAGNGEALIGVNILIEGTQQGTVTDENGNYVLLNVRPGTYTIIFSYIGFQNQQITGVNATTGETTRLDVRMQEEVIEGEEIIVQAERPLVQKDQTASKKTVVAEEIDKLPVETIFGVLATQAGVTQGAGGELHIRGGRSNEISYLVDGLSVSNPFNTNGLATSVAAGAIEEMTVISGAFNAEYGKAMSGIVNLVTKEGGDRMTGYVSFYGGDSFTSHNDIFFTPSNVALRVYTLEGSLSGPLPFYKKLRFYVSGRHDNDEGHIYGFREHLPSDSANFNVSPWYYEFHGVPVSEISDSTQVPRERVAMNPRSSSNVLAKLSTRPFRGAKVEYSFLMDRFEATPFNFAYRYNPDGVAKNRDRSFNHSLHWTHTFNNQTFYTVRLSYQDHAYKSSLYDVNLCSEEELQNGCEHEIDPRYVSTGRILGFPGNNFLMGGNQKGHVKENAKSLRAKFDITRQFGITHEVRAGAELNLHNLDRENFVVLYDGNRYRVPTVESLDSPSHDKYVNQKVNEFSAYAQDKIEFDNFIINAGLRYEYFNPNGYYIQDLLEPQADLSRADPTNLILPRLGVSFPITERGIIHFSYGHFAQMPPLRNMYVNPEFEFPKGSVPTFGNTNLRPERTIQYEMGLQQQLTDQLAFHLTGYFKDIRDYLAPQRVRYSTIAGEDSYNIYLNKAYASVKGVTFSLTKRPARGGLLSATADYTFQIAEGNESDANAFFFNYLSGRENELVVVPLGFDQRHVIAATVTLSRPGNWSASFIGRFETGYPYSPDLFDQNLDLPQNSGRKPSQSNVDAHLYKEFNVQGVNLRMFLKVFNLFDRLNERFVFNDTGRATYSLAGERNQHATWEPNYGRPGIHTLNEYSTRPHYYAAPREIRVGLTLGF